MKPIVKSGPQRIIDELLSLVSDIRGGKYGSLVAQTDIDALKEDLQEVKDEIDDKLDKMGGNE